MAYKRTPVFVQDVAIDWTKAQLADRGDDPVCTDLLRRHPEPLIEKRQNWVVHAAGESNLLKTEDQRERLDYGDEGDCMCV